MHLNEDPRMRVARRCLALAWIFFFLYLTTIMLLSYLSGIEPKVWGLPRWVALGNIIVPIIFVILLIFVAEKGIPDISLTDEDHDEEEAAS
jgi:uncharacterized membrane protein YhdT